MKSLKMSSKIANRKKIFKSKIPVPVWKVKSFNESEEKRGIGKNFPYIPETLSSKSAGKSLPLLQENQEVKPPSRKINKRDAFCKSQPFPTQHSNKASHKNYNISKMPKVKCLKENKQELLKKVTVKKSVKKEAKNAKAVEKYKCSNAPLRTCNVGDIQIEDKLEQNENKLYSSQNIWEKESQKQAVISDFSAQKGIKFEGNEIYRQMILRGRDLSPSVCRLAPGVKLSSVFASRPSAYDQVFQVSTDPHKNALEAIEKMSAKRGNRKLTLPAEKMPLSPYKMRNSLYTPGINPEEEVMKSLEAIRAKRMQKSALKSSQKKVTFNFDIEDFSAKEELSEQKSSANSEDKLTQINEASSENTPSTPVRNQGETNSEEGENCLKSSTLEDLNGHDKSNKESACHERTTNLQSDEDPEISTLVGKYLNILRSAETNNLLIADSNKSPFCSSRKSSSASLYRNCNYSKLMTEAFSCQKTTPQVLPKCTDRNKQRTAKMKICTPRPVSFSANRRPLYNYSPDFLEERNLGNLSNLPPIYTPLVLKAMSNESPDKLSPVKLKLDFAATENDTPKKEISGKIQVPSVRNIVTTSKMLDNLADKECDIFLSNENCPVICGRYLRNPVALTLTEGDEMHFLPIRL